MLKSTYSKYIYKYLTEFFVIVLGISSSFGVESYRADLEEKENGLEALISINKELIEGQEYYTNRRNTMERDVNIMDLIFNKNHPKRIEKLNEICTTKDDMDIALLNYRGFTPSKERYNSTINEGTLKHIDSDNIKILLSKLYVQSLSFIVGNIEDETIVQRNIMEHCQKFYPEIVFAYSDNDISIADQINKILKAVDNDNHLRAMVRYKFDVMGFKLYFLDQYIDLENELRTEINSFLTKNKS